MSEHNCQWYGLTGCGAASAVEYSLHSLCSATNKCRLFWQIEIHRFWCFNLLCTQLDKHYIYIYGKNYVFIFVKTIYNLKREEYHICACMKCMACAWNICMIAPALYMKCMDACMHEKHDWMSACVKVKFICAHAWAAGLVVLEVLLLVLCLYRHIYFEHIYYAIN